MSSPDLTFTTPSSSPPRITLGSSPSSSSSLSATLADDLEVDQILHDLKVFASIKENERVSTTSGVYINKASDKFVALKRLYHGESRTRNFNHMEKRFHSAFAKIDMYLEQRESMLGIDPQHLSRSQVLLRLKNQQMISRLKKGIEAAKDKVSRVFRTTYEDDSAAISRVERICEDIDDRLKQVEASLRYLDEREKGHSGS